MSQAIYDLELAAPPITVTRRPNGWITRCELCGHRTRLRPLLSAAVKDQERHTRGHKARFHLTAPRYRAPLDAVHLDEGAA